MSSTLASVGRFTVLDIEPEMNGWIPAIILTCPIGAIERVPLTGLKAQSKTFKCSSARCGAPSIVSFSSMKMTISFTWCSS